MHFDIFFVRLGTNSRKVLHIWRIRRITLTHATVSINLDFPNPKNWRLTQLQRTFELSFDKFSVGEDLDVCVGRVGDGYGGILNIERFRFRVDCENSEVDGVTALVHGFVGVDEDGELFRFVNDGLSNAVRELSVWIVCIHCERILAGFDVLGLHKIDFRKS